MWTDVFQTNDWILSQTPQFTLKYGSAHSTQEDVGTRIEVNIHQGIIKKFDYISDDCSADVVERARSVLLGSRLQDIRDWRSFLKSSIQAEPNGLTGMVYYLEEFLPIPSPPGS
jgi:lipoate-protein ligase A